jgi:hypothetical protein
MVRNTITVINRFRSPGPGPLTLAGHSAISYDNRYFFYGGFTGFGFFSSIYQWDGVGLDVSLVSLTNRPRAR